VRIRPLLPWPAPTFQSVRPQRPRPPSEGGPAPDRLAGGAGRSARAGVVLAGA